MKVKILHADWGVSVGDIVEAKYFYYMDEDEIKSANEGGKEDYEWDDDDLFIKTESNKWRYMHHSEVEVVE